MGESGGRRINAYLLTGKLSERKETSQDIPGVTVGRKKKTAFGIVIVLEAGLSVCVSGEFESGAKRSAPRLPTRRTHTQKINRNLNATPAIFHPYQNVPTDRREPSVPYVWLSIAPVIFIYFYEKLK